MLHQEKIQSRQTISAADLVKSNARQQHAGEYRLHVSSDLRDPEWDAYVAGVPGGHYVQSAYWSELKAVSRWKVVRIVVKRHTEIVAGVQLLLRPLPFIGSIGYVPRGPLLAYDDPILVELLMEELLATARRQRCRMLIVQPAPDIEGMSARLTARHFQPTKRKVAPTYSVVLDLRHSEDELLANMKRQTRYNVRLGMRKGLTVRAGTEDDLPAYYRLLSMTGARQSFDISSAEYYSRMWQIFRPVGCLELFLVEYGDELVSAQLALGFGDTFVNKMSAWSGEHGKLKPNEMLMWEAIKWARENGYTYYDFGGMSSKVATTILRGDPLTDRMKSSVSSFKLGFGGDVVAFPQAYLYLSNPLLRWGHRTLRSTLENSATVKRIMHRFRTR